MVERKKKLIDGMDRDILRSILQSRRELTSRQIGKKVKLSNSSIIPRLNNLMAHGILKNKKLGMREIQRKGSDKKIKAPRSILWDLDLDEELNREKDDFLFS